MTAIARRVYVRPDDPGERHILYTNGYVQAIGGAAPIPTEDRRTAADSSKSPTFYDYDSYGPVAALAILDWDTPAGYTVDHWGFVWPWGGAPLTPGGSIEDSALGGKLPYTGGPEFLFGSNGGFTAVTFGHVCDFVMSPDADGLGYLATYWGDVLGIGTGIPSISHSAFLFETAFIGWRIQMDWTSKRYAIMDRSGRVFGKNGMSSPSVHGNTAEKVLFPTFPEAGSAALKLYDESASPKGWMLDGYGRMYDVGGADYPYGATPTPAVAQWMDFEIIDDGTGDNPLRLVAMTNKGTMTEWVSSTAPTVEVQTPDDPTTNTTRPKITWTYFDPQGDAQASYEVKVFDSTTVGDMGFDPETSTPIFQASGTKKTVRSVQVDFDLANDTYRAYVQAFDTSGLGSGWEFIEWEQDVTPPATPTVTASVVTSGVPHVHLALHISTSGLDPDTRLAVQYSDDGDTWVLVFGGWDLTPDGSGDAAVDDYQAPFGATRTYRTIAYIYDADLDLWVASGWSSTDDAVQGPRDVWTLTAQDGSGFVTNVDFEIIDFDPTSPTVASVFMAASRRDPIVVTDGAPKLPAVTLHVRVLTAAARDTLQGLVDANEALLVRSVFGDNTWIRIAGDVARTQIVASPTADEETSVRDAHELSAKVQAITRPVTGPSSGPLSEL